MRCHRAGSVCLCADITPIAVRTKFVFLQHPMEFKKIKNGSGRLAHLSLPGSELLLGVDFSEHKRVNELLAEHPCQLLYPDAPGAPIATTPSLEGPQPVLFLIDATWPCAKKMMRLSRNLHDLPRLSLAVSAPSAFVIKHQPHPLCLATIEAVDRTLRHLAAEGAESYDDGDSERLLRPFLRMNEMALQHAADPDRPSYRTRGAYKKPEERRRRPPKTARSVVFRGE